MAKKASVKKAAATKPTAKQPAVKKASAKKTPAQKTVATKSPSKTSAAKPAAKKATAKKASTAKPTAFVPDAIAATRPVKVKRKAAKPKPKAKSTAQPAPAEALDGYLSTLNDWRKDAVARLRTMIQRAVPQADEKVVDSQSVYEHHGPFAWIKAHAKGVNLGFLRGVELPDPRKLLEGTRGTVRHINLSSLKDAGKKELEELVKLASKLNEVRQGEATKKSEGKKAPKKKAAKHK